MESTEAGVCNMGWELARVWRSRLGQCEWLGPAGRSSIRLWRSDAFIDHIPPKCVASVAGGGRRAAGGSESEAGRGGTGWRRRILGLGRAAAHGILTSAGTRTPEVVPLAVKMTSWSKSILEKSGSTP